VNYLVVVAIVLSGIASQYSPNTMENVAKVRSQQGYAIDYTVRHIAVVDCSYVGEYRAVRYQNGSGSWQPWEIVQIIDCARPGDGTTEWMEDNGILLEMGHQRAVELGMVGRGVEVEMRGWTVGEADRCRGYCAENRNGGSK
jgi:hypothetical protein